MNPTKPTPPQSSPPAPTGPLLAPPPVANRAQPKPRRRWPRGGMDHHPLDRRAVLAAGVCGILLDAVVRELVGLGVATLICSLAIGLAMSKRFHGFSSLGLLALAASFGMWSAIRASPWLIIANLVASAVLLLTASTLSDHRRLGALGLQRFLAQPIDVAVDLAETPAFVARGAMSLRSWQRQRIREVVRGLAVATPVVAMLGALLLASDGLSRALLGQLSPEEPMSHAFWVGAGAFCVLALIHRASRETELGSRPLPFVLRPAEATVVLCAVTFLYFVFCVVQVAGAVGIAEAVLDEPADTSAWVHQGFFPLLWASTLTLAVLLVLEVCTEVGSERQHHQFRVLTAMTSLATLGIVASSLVRTLTYVHRFGLTMLRLYSLLFVLWVGLVFVLFALRALEVGSWRDRFGPLCAATALCGLHLLNAINPEAVVVQWAVDHPETVDIDYLSPHNLSADALPTLVANLDQLEEVQVAEILRQFCAGHTPAQPSLAEWNWSRSQASSLLAEVCD